MTNYKPLDVQAVENLVKKGQAVLVDVREADEFAAEHIPYAISAPLSQIDAALPDLAEERRAIIFQCQLGKRGEKACALMEEDTLKNREIYNLEGGIMAWKAAGLSTVQQSSHAPKLPIMRQVQIGAGSLILLSVLAGYPALAGVFGAALIFAGITGWCGMARLLSHMPWNK